MRMHVWDTGNQYESVTTLQITYADETIRWAICSLYWLYDRLVYTRMISRHSPTTSERPMKIIWLSVKQIFVQSFSIFLYSRDSIAPKFPRILAVNRYNIQ